MKTIKLKFDNVTEMYFPISRKQFDKLEKINNQLIKMPNGNVDVQLLNEMSFKETEEYYTNSSRYSRVIFDKTE